MNTTILTRCIEELKSDKPDISYIRGALETLLEMSSSIATIAPPLPVFTPNHMVPNVQRTESIADEEHNDLATAYLRGGTGTVVETTEP